jgi:hypothetical protein
MPSGFFYAVGYIATKIDNIGNSAAFKNPTTIFIKSLTEGSSHAKKEFDHTKQNPASGKTKEQLSVKKPPPKKKTAKKKTAKKKITKKKSSIKK